MPASSRILRVRPGPVIAVLLALAVGFGFGRATAPRVDAELTSAMSLRWGLEERDWLTRTWRLSSYLQELDPEDLPVTLALLEQHFPWLLTDEFRLLMFAWVRFDPRGALQQALAWPARYRRNAAGAALYAWAYRDPEAALDALEGLDEPELAEFLRSRLVEGWAHGPHKQTLSDYIASLPEGPPRLTYASKLAWELVREGPPALVHWAEEVPAADSGYKAEVFAQAASVLASLDPASTAQWLERHLGRDYASRALRVLVRSWAGSDPEASLAWLVTLPSGETRRNAVFEAFGTWWQADPVEDMILIFMVPGGESRPARWAFQAAAYEAIVN